MHLTEIRRLLKAEVLTSGVDMDKDIQSVCGCDLMSDVLAFTRANTLLLTGLTSVQVVRTAEMVELTGIVFVRGKRPSAEVIRLAEETNLPLLSTNYPLYETAGLLYEAGLRGCSQLGEG